MWTEGKKNAIIGLSIFVPSLGLLTLSGFTDPPMYWVGWFTNVLMFVGFSIPYFSISKGSSSPLKGSTLLPPVIFSFGIFYFFAPHIVHEASPFHFGLGHWHHEMFLGVPLLFLAIVVTAILAARTDYSQ